MGMQFLQVKITCAYLHLKAEKSMKPLVRFRARIAFLGILT